jgi:hypothetical protein
MCDFSTNQTWVHLQDMYFLNSKWKGVQNSYNANVTEVTADINTKIRIKRSH